MAKETNESIKEVVRIGSLISNYRELYFRHQILVAKVKDLNEELAKTQVLSEQVGAAMNKSRETLCAAITAEVK